jgi:hypothetical protein
MERGGAGPESFDKPGSLKPTPYDLPFVGLSTK